MLQKEGAPVTPQKAQELKKSLDRAAYEKLLADRTHIHRFVLDAIIDELVTRHVNANKDANIIEQSGVLSNVDIRLRECEERRVHQLTQQAKSFHRLVGHSNPDWVHGEIKACLDRLIAEGAENYGIDPINGYGNL